MLLLIYGTISNASPTDPVIGNFKEEVPPDLYWWTTITLEELTPAKCCIGFRDSIAIYRFGLIGNPGLSDVLRMGSPVCVRYWFGTCCGLRQVNLRVLRSFPSFQGPWVRVRRTLRSRHQVMRPYLFALTISFTIAAKSVDLTSGEKFL